MKTIYNIIVHYRFTHPSNKIIHSHPCYKIIHERRPSVFFVIVLIHIFHYICKFPHHVPQVTMNFLGTFVTQLLKILCQLIQTV